MCRHVSVYFASLDFMLVSMSLLQAHVLSFRLLSWHLDSGFMPTSSYAKPHTAQFIKISSTLLLVFVFEFQEILYLLFEEKQNRSKKGRSFGYEYFNL
jgi:hypothetical protein